jgi:hypothetical protein
MAEGKAEEPNQALLALSSTFLSQVKSGDSFTETFNQLRQYSTNDLIAGLNNDNARKTFWVNLYNAWFQILAQRGLTKPKIFTTRAVEFAGRKFSLDEIEHGILRKYRWKLSLGYLPQVWPGKTIKKLAVTQIDFRIHFALNCGAKSCPPIRSYEYANIDQQLELATSSFLSTETEIDENQKLVRVTKLMQWFRADFGGKSGIKTILSRYLEKDVNDFAIRYQTYDWSARLAFYVDEAKD